MDYPGADPPVQRSAQHLRDARRYGRRSAHPGQTVLSLLHIRGKWGLAQQLCGPVHCLVPMNFLVFNLAFNMRISPRKKDIVLKGSAEARVTFVILQGCFCMAGPSPSVMFLQCARTSA